MDFTDLQSYVGAPESDATYVEQCWDEATALVTAYIGTIDPVSAIPEIIVDRATLEAGSELYHRRQAPNGVAQFSTLDGSPIRVARDPLLGVYPLINRYTSLGLA